MKKKAIIEEILSKPIEKLARDPYKKVPNKEALKLYREVLKFSKHLDWKHPSGEKWGDMIANSARKEFEIARDEKDPLLVMKMIVTSREAIQKTKEQVRTN